MRCSHNEGPRAAAYCRVSTDKEDQRNSLAAQRQFFQEYIEGRPGWSLVGVFADEGLSGTSVRHRPQFTEMIRRAMAGEIDLILTKEVSRFARNTVDTLQVTRQLKEAGVGVVFLNDNIDTRDNDGEFRLTIMASVAQEESRKISERTRWGQAQALKRGVVFGNNSLYGYTLKNGQLIVQPEQAQVVRRVYHKFLAERKGTYVIARELTEAGVPPPLRPQGAWSSTMVLRILRNEKYCGDLLQRKYRTTDHLTHRKIKNDGAEPQVYLENHHEGLVTRAEYEAAQAELDRRRGLSADSRRFSARYWYSGKIVCACCGSSFTLKRTRRADGREYRRFVCRNRTALKAPGGQEPCRMRSVNAQIIFACARHVLDHLPLDREAIIDHLLADLQELHLSRSPLQDDSESLQQAIQRQQLRKKRALDAFLDGAIGQDDMRDVVERCEAQLQRLHGLLAEREALGVSLQTFKDRYGEIRQFLVRELAGGDCVLEEVIERITVYDDHFLIRIHELPIQFRLRAEGTGAGRGYRINILECTPIPVDP